MAEYFRVKISAEAKKMLLKIGQRYGKRTYEILRDMILDLEFDPDKKGEPLRGHLKGFYSRHYSRFRIVYTIQDTEAIVFVVGAGFHSSGSRTDIYRVIQRLVRSGIIRHPKQHGEE